MVSLILALFSVYITAAQAAIMNPGSLINSTILMNQPDIILCMAHLGLALWDSSLSYIHSIFPRKMIKAV